MLEGHRLRQAVRNAFEEQFDMVYHKHSSNPPDKRAGLADFRFQVVIENSNMSTYFSEKLIDALLMGTVPVYWGPPAVSDFFNM